LNFKSSIFCLFYIVFNSKFQSDLFSCSTCVSFVIDDEPVIQVLGPVYWREWLAKLAKINWCNSLIISK
jgi:hypothetical protein